MRKWRVSMAVGLALALTVALFVVYGSATLRRLQKGTGPSSLVPPGHNVFPAQGRGGWGYIDVSGAWVIHPRFKYCWPFEEGFGIVELKRTVLLNNPVDHGFARVALVGADGRLRVSSRVCVVGKPSEGLVAAVRVYSLGAFGICRDLQGFIDTSGSWQIEPRFKWVGDFSEGLAVAVDTDTGNSGYISRTGEWAIAPKYQDAGRFSEGAAFVKNNGVWGIIDHDGRVREIQDGGSIWRIAPFSDGLAAVFAFQDDETIGFLSKDGTWAFRIQASPLLTYPEQGFFEGLAAVYVKGTSGRRGGYIDRSGNWVIPPKFLGVQRFSEGKAAVKSADGLWGYISTEGDFVIPPVFAGAESFRDGLAAVNVQYDAKGSYRTKIGGYIDETGRFVWQFKEHDQYAAEAVR